MQFQSVDHRSIRVALMAPQITSWGLQQLVQSHGGLVMAVVAGHVGHARQLLATTAVDVMVADVDDPGQLAQMPPFLREHSELRVLALTGTQETSTLEALVVQGLRGIVRKSEPPETLLRAVDRVAAGELWIDRRATGRIFMEMVRHKAAHQDDPEVARIATLTKRERQAISALLADASAPGKVIASRLCISENTLRNHLSSIYSKLELSNRLDLYSFATRHQLDKAAAS